MLPFNKLKIWVGELPPIFSSSLRFVTYLANFSIREINKVLISTTLSNLLEVSNKVFIASILYSSGKVWIAHSIKYCYHLLNLIKFQ